MVMKFFPHVQNCGPSIKMQKNRKNNFGNIFKIFSENCWNIFRKSAKRGRKTPIFEKYFKNVPKIIFSIFWHFYTRPAILYVWKKFHNHSFFPSYFFHHLKIGGRWHISYRLTVLGHIWVTSIPRVLSVQDWPASLKIYVGEFLFFSWPFRDHMVKRHFEVWINF